MGRDRSGLRKGDVGRVAGAFVALPLSVLDSPAYAAASHTDRALLIEIARQCVGDNNGRLLASRAYLAGRGWKSAGVIHRAVQNLLALNLIHQTVQGHRPNKASWFALTWRLLDPHPGYDPGAAATFERGSYLRAVALQPVRRLPPRRAGKNAGLCPMAGTEMPPIGPLEGQGQAAPVPLDGPVQAPTHAPPVPFKGHHLETPSARQGRKGAAGLKAFKASPAVQAAATVIERVRDCDLDPERFDPISGECLPAIETAPKASKRAAAAWVSAALRQAGKAGAAHFADFAEMGEVSEVSASDVGQHAES